MSDAARRFPFFAGVWSASAPLLLWSVHFAFCYVVSAVGCTAVSHGATTITPARLHLALVAGTVLALALGGWLLVRACRRAAAGGDLMPNVAVGSAALAWIAMLWNGVPLALLPACSLP
jgi:hypothetical protein